MAKNTKIQWCDDSVNPVMGCDGCELWPTPKQILQAVKTFLRECNPPNPGAAELAAAKAILGTSVLTTDIHHRRFLIAGSVLQAGGLTGTTFKKSTKELAVVIADACRCYAGNLHLMRGENSLKPDKRAHKGYAAKFEHATLFPGRMATASGWAELIGTARPEKPWLNDLPRQIFVSDMGDALSANILFEDLKKEIIHTALSEKGQRSNWLWLTKRPLRMAKFGAWLAARGIPWPDNLVPMTSVTSKKTVKRVDQLRRVPSRYRGLSVEPLWEEVTLDLEGIDWAIVGGESGSKDRPFDLDWARSLHRQCAAQGTAFFVKQLGSAPIEGGQPLKLKDAHGGDWDEWPEDLRIREFPSAWYGVMPAVAPAAQPAP